jgi:hypothetical protein
MFDTTNLWIEVILGDPPVSKLPRIKLNSNFFAMRAIKADSALNVGPLNDDLVLDQEGDGTVEAIIELGGEPSAQIANLSFYTNEELTSKLWGEEFGELRLLYAGQSIAGAQIYSDFNGGYLRLRDYTYDDDIVIDAGQENPRLKVQFPDSVINSEEILDEPGLASDINSSGAAISAAGVTNIVYASITIPNAGYIIATGSGVGAISGTSHGNIILGLETTYSGEPTGPYDVSYGSNNAAQTEYTTSWYPIYIERSFYYANSTTVNIFFNARRNYTDGTATVYYGKVRLLYIPTSYGSISKIASADDAADFENTVPVQVSDLEGKNAATMFEVDLRELELKAKEARIKALKAELELQQAKEKARE